MFRSEITSVVDSVLNNKYLCFFLLHLNLPSSSSSSSSDLENVHGKMQLHLHMMCMKDYR